MKKLFLIIFLLAASVAGTIWLTGCDQKSRATATTDKQLYTCGMHPQVIQDHPGNCPICGMKLTPIRKQDAASNAASSPGISVDAATMQNMNLRTTEIVRGPLRKTIRTVGSIDYNETAIADV